MCEYETNNCGCGGNTYNVNTCGRRDNDCGCGGYGYRNNGGCGILGCFSDNTLLIIAIIILFILLFCRGNESGNGCGC